LFGGRMSAGCSYSISSTAKSWVGHWWHAWHWISSRIRWSWP